MSFRFRDVRPGQLTAPRAVTTVAKHPAMAMAVNE
jgi:hypothetical protein